MSSNAAKKTISFKRLVVPVGMRSIYWKYFGFPGNDEGEILTREKIICTLCKTQMVYNGNTSNLRMHLQNKHPPYLLNLEATTPPYVPKSRDKVSKSQKRKSDTNPVVHAMSFDGSVELGSGSNKATSQSTGIKFISIGGDGSDSPNVEYITTDSLGDTVTYYLPDESAGSSSSANQQQANVNDREIIDATLRFLASELLAPSIVEGQGFQHLITKINPSTTLPSCKQLEEECIPLHYEELRGGVISELECVSDVSLSVEEWYGIDNKIFITFCAHFLHQDQLVSRIISTIKWNENNKELINKTLSGWGIQQERVVAILTATSEPKILEALEEWATVVPCFLFTLQLAVAGCLGLPQIKSLLNKCRAIINSFKLQQSFSTDETCYASYNIPLDYSKNWTSTYEMLQEFLNNKSEIHALTISNENKITINEWNILNSIIEVFSPFKVTVQTLQEENPALLSIIKPLLWQLITNYLQIKDDETDLIETIKLLLKSKLSNAFNCKSNGLLLQTVTTLDPRFKQLSYATEEEGAAVQQNIKSMLSQMVSQFGDVPQSVPAPPAATPTKKKVSGMELLLGDLCSSVKQEARPPGDRAELELGQYTSESPIAFDENPLVWWHNAESKCPNLSRLAKKYMCIPACAIPADRIPIKQRETFERQRATLSIDLVDKMIFLNGNLL